MNIQQKPVSNYTPGRFGYRPEAIVVHIAQGTLVGAYSWFNNKTSQASSHYMIGKNGEIWQFVNDNDTAWHAGGINNPSWALLKGNVNPNFYTIGIEHEGFTGEGWSEAMYKSSGELIGNLCKRFNIPIDRVHIIGHYQINSVSRKNCPGTGVDFNKLISLALNYYEDPNMIRELQEQVNNLKRQLTDAQATNTALNQQNQQLLAKISELSAGSNDSQVQILRQTVTDLSKEIERLQKTQADMSSKITQLTEENKQLKDGLSNQSAGTLFNTLIGKVFGSK